MVNLKAYYDLYDSRNSLYVRYFEAPKKLMASSWLPYNGRIVWQLGVPIWETQDAASSKDDILIRLLIFGAF